MDDDTVYSPSLKNKLKQSLCFSCCFGRRRGHHHPLNSLPPSSFVSDDKPKVIWIEPKGQPDLFLSDVKMKCRTMLGFSGTKHKRYSSAEFRYDPLSYALNFEDGCDDDDEVPLRNFTARLPASPSVKPRQVPAGS
ncbi:Hypothetical predicted protein [Olea europaea subsp. europaea]|uniref:Uncharacterized protein n=1 Tax=Olea europaea subsp. europaea TaxID=158383 RepID=A0A8S0PLS8_OLEEU|nr:Hypothetical predicted protein [Olea europaea subsp. europaea]